MTQDVRQWLNEIRVLQQKLAELRQELDEAYAGASNWRKLYETEAQQRRTEATLTKQTIDDLKAEIQQARALPSTDEVDSTTLATIHHDIENLESDVQLKERLRHALIECDRLSKALKIEQANHAKTRQALTTALGDAVDMLAKEKKSHDKNGSISKELDSTKSPLLELSQLDQARSLA